jgi:hypothetical protein
MTWLHAFFLGICTAERGSVEIPLQLFAKSMEAFPSPVTARSARKNTFIVCFAYFINMSADHRNIAVLQSTQEKAWFYYEVAFNVRFSNDSKFYLG